MKVIEPGRNLRHTVHDDRPGQARLALLDEHSAEVRPLHPIHHHHVASIDEEVVPHRRQTRMRRQAEQHPSLRQQRLPLYLLGALVHLQRHRPIMSTIDRLQHRRLSAPTDRRQHLIPVRQHLPGHHCSPPRRSLIDTAPRCNATFANCTRRGPATSSTTPNFSYSLPKCCFTAASLTTSDVGDLARRRRLREHVARQQRPAQLHQHDPLPRRQRRGRPQRLRRRRRPPTPHRETPAGSARR